MGFGIVYKAISGFYYVKSDNETTQCIARGRLRHNKFKPLVGDIVDFTPTEVGKGVLTYIHTRKNSFSRPPLVNIDNMVICCSAAIPATDTHLIDKIVAIAEKNNCNPIICINKVDIDDANLLYGIYKKAGFDVLRVSAKTGEGIANLSSIISKKTSAFTGNSGVGKSSLLNAICPNFNIKTGELSQKLGKGRHTTRHVELYELHENTFVADTPGFSAFDTGHLAEKEEIADLFREFVPYLSNCRFSDCLHINEPDCNVQKAISVGNIGLSRYNSYVRLVEEELKFKSWEK